MEHEIQQEPQTAQQRNAGEPARVREVVLPHEEFSRTVGPELNRAVDLVDRMPHIENVRLTAGRFSGEASTVRLPESVWNEIARILTVILTFAVIWGSVIIYARYLGADSDANGDTGLGLLPAR